MIRRILRVLALNGVLIVLYVALGRLTFSASVEFGNVSHVMFAPKGVTLAFAILFGNAVLPSVLLGQTILSCWSGITLLGALGIGTLNVLEAWLGGHLFRRWGLSRGFDRPRDVLLFTLMIFCILQPISATGGVMQLYAIGRIPAETTEWLGSAWLVQDSPQTLMSLARLPSAWVSWWLTNSLGQLLVTPLLVAWLTPRKLTTPAPHPLKLAAMLVGTLCVLLLIYDNPALRPVLLALEYAFMIWIGLRHSIRAVTTFNMLVMAIMIWEATQGGSFLSSLPVSERHFYVSFFVATGVFASLILFSLFEERRDLINQLTDLASTDALTQVSNRRHFIECAERELAHARRYAYPVSLVLIDLDHFKAINDQYGHDTGDRVLRRFALHCKQIIRTSDMVGRLGGEEFALLLSHTDADAAIQATERLRRIVCDEHLSTSTGASVRFTFSAGVVESNPTATLESLLRAADQAMYEAKHAGRNQTKKAATHACASPPAP